MDGKIKKIKMKKVVKEKKFQIKMKKLIEIASISKYINYNFLWRGEEEVKEKESRSSKIVIIII